MAVRGEKTDFIRKQMAMGVMDVKAILKAARAEGVKLSEASIYNERSQQRAKGVKVPPAKAGAKAKLNGNGHATTRTQATPTIGAPGADGGLMLEAWVRSIVRDEVASAVKSAMQEERRSFLARLAGADS